MSTIRFLSIVEQVAMHLRGELQRGRWCGQMPGKHHLAEELGVNNKTVESALRQLEAEGLLVAQGAGRRRLIQLSEGTTKSLYMRVAILLYERGDRVVPSVIDIHHTLAEAGHLVFFAAKALVELGMEVKRVARLVERTDADAWVIVAGSRDVLEWFSKQAKPCFGFFGSWSQVPIAGSASTKDLAYAALVRALAARGHRRIVLLTRPERRKPSPGSTERAFLAALEAEGIPASAYNLPHWENTKEDFHRCLDALFRITPPTAMVVQEAVLFAAVQQFLAGRRLRVPQDVSLVCADPDPTFAWREPSIAHITMDSRPWNRRISRWAANVSRGKDDHRQVLSKAEFVVGGTIGPVAGR
jgi:DNA-binding LacI/PurR family transcriptional regulator/DNA-binding transcriptional regulator YhcF (GntR family)